MSLFSSLPGTIPKLPTLQQPPALGSLGDTLLGLNVNTANNPATNASNVSSPFCIPVANPHTGAIQLIQGTLKDGLTNLDSGAKAVLANAAEIPIVHADGSVTVVPGGKAGLQNIQNNPETVLASAPVAAKLNINPAAIATSKAANPFQLLPNPITGATSIVEGTFSGGVSGITSLSQQTLANTPHLPIVLPNGQLSLVKGGLDGLAALQENAHSVLEKAPKLPKLLDLASSSAALLTSGQSNIFSSLQSAESILETVMALPSEISAFSKDLIANSRTYVGLLFSEDVGPAEIDTILATHANSVVKLTVGAIVAMLGVIAAAVVTAISAVGVFLAAVPLLAGFVGLLGLETLLWRHWSYHKTSGSKAATSGNGVSAANT